MNEQQLAFTWADMTEQAPRTRPIEVSFPLAEISLLAERESWRKEIFRPLYHIHKWWANRLGSIFRAIVLGAIGDSDQDVWGDFYKEHDFAGKIVLDPFMGSGTTLGEAAKLGAKPIGCDINPISTFAVTQALTRVDIRELERTFLAIEADVKDEISQYYTTRDPQTGELIPVLYYFWVKVVEMPSGEEVPLFNSYVFSKNAYPKRKPQAQIICPQCWHINAGRYDAEKLTCAHCHHTYNPQQGPADGKYVADSKGNMFEIKSLLPKDRRPPKHRLYALMALRANEEKVYLAIQEHDLTLVRRARQALERTSLPLPTMPVRSGHNTDQARTYQYLHWRDFFNERQLLCLGILLKRVMQIPDPAIRGQFLCLFSTSLEYNNLFCSFKGEGTGAVRPLFSHHILKPERSALENNVWGTPQSSGSFSRLFKSKLLKAKQYLDQPFELRLDEVDDDAKAANHIASRPIDFCVTSSWETFSAQQRSALVLNGDSAALPIPDKVVDAIVTDPPYFDFVHYSELSDFFFAWLALLLGEEYPYFNRSSSHHKGEVQNKHPEAFATNLARVFRESHRVLKDDGLLVFSFHHSRPDGWAAIYRALKVSGFQVVAAYPVYAEMRGASPKSGTKEPISVDIILVCKKSDFVQPAHPHQGNYAQALSRAGIELSTTDAFNIHAGQLLIAAGHSEMEPVELRQHLDRLKGNTIG
jgi:putative DNA methylase